MIDRALLQAQLPHTLARTDLPIPGKRQGKVRDVYDLGDRLLLVASDRLSAFDVILTTLPFKGQILTEMASFWFEATRDVAPNHVIAQPDPAALLARKCRALPVEVVVRGYLTGSLWRDHERGDDPYELSLPRSMKRDQAFETAIITPSTKEEMGKHDQPLSSRAVVERGLVPAPVWRECERLALGLFRRGQEIARSRGLILVDTKYEFGLAGDELLVIDEIHTPDSSRYWEAAEYEARFAGGLEQRIFGKENLRQWLIQEHTWMGIGPAPFIPDDVRLDLAANYVATYERVTGRTFAPATGDPLPRLTRNLRAAGLL